MLNITKRLIINNFDWIINNQVAMDMLEIEGLRDDLLENYEQIKILIPDDLVVEGDLLELDAFEGSHLYNYFIRLNSIQMNKDTYLPNLVGIYIVEHTV
jgi:hypothetical protein